MRRSLLIVLIGLSACSKPSPTVNALTISGLSDFLFLGSTMTANVTASMSDGTTESVTSLVTWTVTPNSAATVTTAGVVTATGSAGATLQASYQGRSATVNVRVLPNYQGNWIGQYSVASCTPMGSFITTGFCGTFPVGQVLPVAWQLTQNRDVLNGRVSLGQILSDSFSVSIGSDGGVVILTNASLAQVSIAESWNVRSGANGTMTGSAVFLFSDTPLTGTGRLTVDMFNTNKQASTLAMMRAPVVAASLADVLAALRR